MDLLLVDLLILQHFICQRLHLDEPLLGQIRFDDDARTLGMTDLMHMLFDVIDHAGRFEISHQRLAAGEAVHARILSAQLIHRTIRIHADRHRQIIFLGQHEVVGIVRRAYIS